MTTTISPVHVHHPYTRRILVAAAVVATGAVVAARVASDSSPADRIVRNLPVDVPVETPMPPPAVGPGVDPVPANTSVIPVAAPPDVGFSVIFGPMGAGLAHRVPTAPLDAGLGVIFGPVGAGRPVQRLGHNDPRDPAPQRGAW